MKKREEDCKRGIYVREYGADEDVLLSGPAGGRQRGHIPQ